MKKSLVFLSIVATIILFTGCTENVMEISDENSGKVTREEDYKHNEEATKPESLGSVQYAIKISSAEELAKIGNEETHPLDGTYVQTADIDLSGYSDGDGWEPIGTNPNVGAAFTGSYDGGGHTISELYINRTRTHDIGLFGYVDGGVLANIGLDSVQVTGNRIVGGLVGYIKNGTTVINSFVTGNVTATSTVSGGVGGLVGVANSSSSINNSYALVSVTGLLAGGLVGVNQTSTIENSYARGSVIGYPKSSVGGLVGSNPAGSTIKNTYAKVVLNYADNNQVGGLVGSNADKSIVTNSYYDLHISGINDTGKGEPKTTAEMKQEETFVGWCFEDFWAIDSSVNDGYPYLLMKPLFEFDSGTGTITGYNGTDTDVEIPSSILGVPVTTIGNSAFENNHLTSVVIGDTVTSLEPYAFMNNELTEVVIPDSVTSIGYQAFRDNNLTSVVIGNSVEMIADGAFAENELESVLIVDSVEMIEVGAFSDNDLTSIEIGSGVDIGDDYSMGNYNANFKIFYDDNEKKAGVYTYNGHSWGKFEFESSTGTITGYNGTPLADLEIPSSIGGVAVTSIGSSAFEDNELESVKIPNSMTSIGNSAFENNHLTSVVIGDSVTSIESYAFMYNELTEVTIPDSVTSIGYQAFRDTNLTSIEIGSGVDIGDDYSMGVHGASFKSFYENRDEREQAYIYTYDGDEWNFVQTFVFDNGTIIDYIGSATDIVIPSSIDGQDVTSIGFGAFKGWSLANPLTSVDIPDSVTSIGDYAFTSNNLTSVDIPDSVTTIGNNAFASNNLTSVDIPDSVTNLDLTAFARNNLTSFVIPDGVTSIPHHAFSYNNLTNIEIPDGVTFIGNSAFKSNNLTSIVIPDSVTGMGTGVFRYNNLTSVDIGEGITSIPNFTFETNELTSVVIPDSVTSISNDVFRYNNLTSVQMPAGVDIGLYSTMGSPNGESFKTFYSSEGQQAGVYTYDGSNWQLQ